MRILLTLATTAALVMAGAVPATAAPAPKSLDLGAYLTGQQEVPQNSGDPDASGLALLQLSRDGRLCYVLRVRNVSGTVTAAHIHEGRAGKDGPVSTALTAPAWHGSVATCTDIGGKLARRIWDAPRKFYVNVHSATYPDGALRGQLHRG